MDTIQRTNDILVEAEKALAALASEAAKGTHYETATCLIDAAREVRNVAATTLRRLGDASQAKTTTDVAHEPNATDKSIGTTIRAARRVQKNTYPKFLRQGQDLVKIGWSPSEKAEYEHRCSKTVLLLLAAAVAKAGAKGKRFAMDQVMPLENPADGTRIPDYQAYLSLAWFRELGFVIQHGRQGYSLASKAPIEPLLETHWMNLPAR